MRGARRALLAAALALAAVPAPADEARAWAGLRAGGYVAFVREADAAPGSADCRERPGLSPEGLAQARRLADRFRREGVRIARIYASPSCASRDTAAAFGRFEEWGSLAGARGDARRAADRARRVKNRIGLWAAKPPAGAVVMVTDAASIAQIARQDVAPGEAVVVRPDGCCGLRLVGRIGAAP